MKINTRFLNCIFDRIVDISMTMSFQIFIGSPILLMSSINGNCSSRRCDDMEKVVTIKIGTISNQKRIERNEKKGYNSLQNTIFQRQMCWVYEPSMCIILIGCSKNIARSSVWCIYWQNGDYRFFLLFFSDQNAVWREMWFILA